MAVAAPKQRAFFISHGEGASPTVISFDAVIRESHSSELTVTENPVETGVVISDHAFMVPLKLDIEAAVGDIWLHATYDPFRDDNPIDSFDPFRGGNVADLAPVSPNLADPFATSTSRSEVAFALLQQIQRSADPFTVQTGLRLYQNMLMTTLSADQDKDLSGFLLFHASLREVIIVNTQTVVYPPRKPGKHARQAAKSVTAGEKQGTPTGDTTDQSAVLSLLTGTFDQKVEKAKAWAQKMSGLGAQP